MDRCHLTQNRTGVGFMLTRYESLDSLEGGEFLGQRSDRHLKKEAALWS
jgi:hypothetical protein